MLGNIVAGTFSVPAPPIAPSSYESIATINGDGSSQSLDFTSIPSTYKHLQLRAFYIGTSGSGTLRLRVGNGSIDTGSNYAQHQLSGNGSSASATSVATSSDTSYLLLESQQTYGWAFVMDILDYASTSKNKTIRTLTGGDNNGSGHVGLTSTLWMQQTAITNLRISTQSGAFTTTSQFALYGIKD
jgi:hypothetical protein